MCRRYDKWKIAGLLSTLVLITACSNLGYSSSKEQVLARYEITLPENLKKNLNSKGPSLLVYPIQTSSLYSTSRIAYRLKQFEVSYYAQNEWADTPAHMLLPTIIANMENSNLFSAVVNSGSSAITDLALDPELLTLIHQYEEEHSKIILSVRVQLINLRNRTVIASDTLTIEEVAPSNDPYGAVVATNVAAKKLFSSMQDFVTQAVQLK